MLSDSFLTKKTAQLCREYFPQKQISNLLVVRWGKAWQTKLGHIKPYQQNTQFGSLIEINAVLNDERIPEFVVEATILHELIHYFQGFGSNQPRTQRHPHQGGVIEKEFAKFGWQEIAQKQDTWIHANFARYWKEFEQKNKTKQAVVLKKN